MSLCVICNAKIVDVKPYDNENFSYDGCEEEFSDYII